MAVFFITVHHCASPVGFLFLKEKASGRKKEPVINGDECNPAKSSGQRGCFKHQDVILSGSAKATLHLGVLLPDDIDAQIGHQGLGDLDAPVRLLVVLQHRHPGAAHGEAGAVEGMQELGLGFGVRALPP